MSRAAADAASRNSRPAATRARTRCLPGSRRCRRRRRLIAERLEIHFRRNIRTSDTAEVRLRDEAEHVGHEIRWKLLHGRVELLYDLVVAPPLNCDTILGPFELRLQLQKILVRFQIGIPLHDDQQPRERVAQSALCGFELRHRLWAVWEIRLRARRSAAHRDLTDA